MIEALKDIDRRVALGILARAALAVEDDHNPAAKTVVEHEATIRRAVVHQACQTLGIKEAKTSDEITRIADYLDAQSDLLAGNVDINAAYARLAASGHLPSDLYDVQIGPNIRNDLGKRFEFEDRLIRKTIAAPTREQHFGASRVAGEPCLISLFSRRFRTPYPFKNFVMVVGGQRGENNLLTIHQAWRVYPSLVDISGSKDLVGLLSCFANHYGFEIDVDGKKGKFFLSSDAQVPATITVEIKKRPQKINVSQFQRFDSETRKITAALVVAIDLLKYTRDLDQMDAEIIGEFASDETQPPIA